MSKFTSALLSLAIVASLVLASLASAELVELNPENFKKIVSDPTKNVFVMFYAPWCGHCNNMKPTWLELAKEYPVDGDTIIARVDASMHRDIGTANAVKGFPTIKFYSKTNKAGVEYSGPRELSAFKLFMKRNGM